MREFQQLATEVFGGLAHTVIQEQVLIALDNYTAKEALAAGVDPAKVWHVLCEVMDVPASQRWGEDPKRLAPPHRR